MMIDSFLTQHSLLAAMASFLMVAVLPGFLLWRIVGLNLSWLTWPAALAISLVINFQLVFYLTLLGAFNLYVLASLVLFSLGASAYLARKRLDYCHAPALEIEASCARATLHSAPVALGICLAVVTTSMLLMRISDEQSWVFEAWDAVISWNRWALDWYQGGFPRNTYGYPQLIPSAWAATYVWFNSGHVEFVAKGLMMLFPFGVMAVFLDMFLRTRSTAPLYALVFWPIVLLRIFPDIIDSGYVDIPVAFFILLSAYVLNLSHVGLLRRDRAWLLAAIFSAGAVLTKQAGWLAFIFLLIALASQMRSASLGYWKDVRRALLFFFLLTIPALVYQYYGILKGTDPSNVQYLTSAMHAGQTLPERFIRAVFKDTAYAIDIFLPTPIGVILLFVLFLSSILSPAGRRCWFVCILPYYAVWALFFSYDLRNLMPAMPFLCFGLGLGVQTITQCFFPHKQSKIVNARKPSYKEGDKFRVVLITLGLFLMGSALPKITRNSLVKLNETRHVQSGDVGLNKALMDYSRSPGFDGEIFSTYTPVATIEGLREHFFSTPDKPSSPLEFRVALKESNSICYILGLIPENERFNYIVFHVGLLRGVVDHALEYGDLSLLAETDQFRFMKVICPAGRINRSIN